jgi:Terminase large subunit, T4likevirus-type, N-terminal
MRKVWTVPGTDLVLGKATPLPIAEEKISEEEGERSQDCTLFSDFKPKPGGQAAFFERVPLDRLQDSSFRAIWQKGGVGSGKSYVGSAFVCSRAYLDPTSRGLITANTYSQLETSTLVALAEFCDRFNIPIEPKRATVEETAKAIAARRLVRIFDASLLVLSAEAFAGQTANSKEAGRGLQIRYCWADEYAYASKSSWQTLNGRLGRGEGKIKGFALITSSINRNDPYNWLYDIMEPTNEERSPELQRLYTAINCLTADNDSLDPDYVPTLMASYTPELAAIELRGEYAVSREGTVFHYFDRAKHVKPQQYNRLYPLHVNFDFNVHPATATIAQDWEGKIHILKEIYQHHSDTFRLSAAAVQAIDQVCGQLQPFSIEIHGDATGANKTANSNQSNWDIVFNALQGKPWVQRFGRSNPPVVDTINSVQSLLYHDRLEVDLSCKELIKDFETVRYDAGGGLDKKSDLMRCQAIDGVRYLCFDQYPYESLRTYGAYVGGKISQPEWNGRQK